jgi:phage baseplate assembly protein W
MSTIQEEIERYSDVNPRFDIKNSNVIETGIEAINGSIENIIGTGFGERWFLPNFGSRLQSLLFRLINQDTANLILNELNEAIQKWEPRVRVSLEESYVIPFPDEGMYQVLIVYKLISIDVRGEFEATISP